MANTVAAINFPACFMLKEVEKVSLVAAAGHEMMGAAAVLAREAREIEKSNDTLFRNPHAKDGKQLAKTKLLDKPT
jgi:methylenetetrahydromethanopterin dehydrogenase